MSLSSNNPNHQVPRYDDSTWEEQAFAEDAAGALGCVWPPRSYSCSFCRREFRSAQALGGHMNVHRRDRARLKQSPITSPQGDHHILNQNHEIPNIQFSSSHQVCNLGFNNPKPNSSNPMSLFSSSSSSVILSPASVVTSSMKDKSLGGEAFCSSIFVSPKLKSNMDVATDNFYHFSDLMKNHQDGVKNEKILQSDLRAKTDYVRTDLSVSLNVVLRQSTYEEENFVGCKRKRVDHDFDPEVIELSPSSSVDEVDLELRLGKVN